MMDDPLEQVDQTPYYNVWSEHTSFANDTSPITALEYDNCFDLLWMAHANGRLSSYSFSDETQYLENQAEEDMYMPSPPSMFPFSSFPASSDGIMQILPNQNTLVSIGCSKIRMMTHGGGGLGSWKIDHCPNPSVMGGMKMLSSAEAAYTCADLIRDPTVSRTSSAYLASSLIAGTSSAGAYLFDLTQSVDSPIMAYNVFQPTVKIQSNGHLIAVAGQDGNIRILDGKFRSAEVTKMIEAHSGSIRDVCMQSDGRTLITCGTSKRAVNPYDPKSPCHYSSDVQIRVFDLRMHRMLSPLQVTAPPNSVSGVGYLRLIPQVDTDPMEFGSLLMCTDDGIVQVSDLTAADPSSPEASQVLYAPLSTGNEIVTSAAVSSSGQFLAVGTSGGAVGQYAKPSAVTISAFHHDHSGSGMKSTELYRVNEMSPHMKTGPARGATTPAPLLSLSVDNPVLGTAYTLCAPHHTPAMLSSSFAMTPAVVKRKLRLVPTSRVSEELLGKTSSRQDFIRIIPNPGYRPNSMKNVPKATPTTSAATGATLRPPYAVCDPRKVQILQQQMQQAALANGTGAFGGANKPFSRSNSHNADLNSLDGSENAQGDSTGAQPPKPYLKLSSSNMSKQRFKKFNYASVNDTPCVGLENNVPNSLINPILQLCYALVPLREQALLSQLNAFHYQEAHQGTVICELGFLFHMIRLVEEYAKCAGPGAEVDRVVRAANFQRVFQTLQLIPEAVALSLFDETVQSDLQQFVQKFVPFLLRLLAKEVDSENAWRGPSKSRNALPPSSKSNTANVVDELFGYSILPSTTFLHSGVYKVDPKQHRAMVLDLIYPSLTSPQGGLSSSKKPAGSGKNGPLSPIHTSTSSDHLTATARAAMPKYKVTGRKDRTNASFAAVLWGSFQREISMKGWCAESDSYEPFKKVQSLISLPKILTLLCGNTCADVKDSTTLAGAMGETVGQGSTHSNYWSWPLVVTAPAAEAAASPESPSKLAQSDPLLSVRPGESREFAWLPVEVEVAFRTRSDAERPAATGLGIDTFTPAVSSKLVVSCRCVPFDKNAFGEKKNAPEMSIWIIYDGGQEIVSERPASQSPAFDFAGSSAMGQGTGDWVVRRFRLLSLVLQVTPPPPAALAFGIPIVASASADKKHLVLQINKAPVGESGAADWHLFNDFVVEKVSVQEVVSFPAWKHPCIVCFEACGANEPPTISPAGAGPLSKDRLIVPASVLQLESLSRIPSIRLLQSFATLPGPGDLIAFDGEFVSVSLEKSIINAAGERVVSEEVRQVLARISLLDMGHGPRDTETSTSSSATAAASAGSTSPGGAEGPGATVFNKNMMRIIADDYILPVEPVLDYVTRFSGITEEDLNPVTSKHSILTQRAAYLKLRYFIDAKCVFVGHGLQKDFETANIFVPPEQIRDTVELWRLPNQRKISLRFLASYILKEDIQDEIHDSIEDAKTSLLLYKRYKALAAEGPEKVNAALQDLYQFGNRSNWTIGVDKLVR